MPGARWHHPAGPTPAATTSDFWPPPARCSTSRGPTRPSTPWPAGPAWAMPPCTATSPTGGSRPWPSTPTGRRPCARGTALLDHDAPGDALFTWLGDFVDHVASRRHLAQAAPEDDRRAALFAAWHEAMRGTTGALVDRARRAGAVRTDLDAGDLLRLAAGIAVTDPAGAGRLLDLVRRGTGG